VNRIRNSLIANDWNAIWRQPSRLGLAYDASEVNININSKYLDETDLKIHKSRTASQLAQNFFCSFFPVFWGIFRLVFLGARDQKAKDNANNLLIHRNTHGVYLMHGMECSVFRFRSVPSAAQLVM